MPRRAPVAGRRCVPRIVAGSVFAGVVVVIAATAAWPIYRSWALVLLVAVSVAVAAGIAAVAWRRRWGGWLVAAALAIAFLVLGIPLAVPSRLGGPADLLRGFGELTHGALLRVEGPRHRRSAGRVVPQPARPGALVFLVGTCATAAAVVARGPGRVRGGAGRHRDGLVRTVLRPHHRERSARARPGLPLRAGRDGPGPRDAARVPAVARLADARGAPPGAAAGGGVERRPRLACALARRPASHRARRRHGRGRPGDRGGRRALRRARRGPRGAPLRDRARDRPLRRGQSRSPSTGGCSATRAPTRCCSRSRRTARCPSGCGSRRSTRTTARSSAAAAPARSMPAASCACRPSLDAGEGRPVEAEITVDDLDGIWMPTAGRLASVDFAGDRAASLADRFYYSAAAAAGVQTAGGGLEAGDAYVVRGVEPRAADLAAIDAPGGVSAGVAAPESLRTWVEEHVVRLGRRGARRARVAAARARLPQPRSLGGRGVRRLDGGAARLHVPAERVRALPRPHRRAVRAPARARDRSPRRGVRQLRRGGRRRRAVRRRDGAHRAGARLPGAGRARRAARLGRARAVRRATTASAGRRTSPRGPRCSPRTATGCAIDVTPQYAAVAEPRGHRAARPRERHRGASATPSRRCSRPTRCRRTPASDDAADEAVGARSRLALADAAHRRPRRCSCSRSLLGPFLVVDRREGRATPIAPHAGARRPPGSPAAGTSTWMPRSTRGVRPRACSPAASSPRRSRHPPAPSSPRPRTAPCSRAPRPPTRTPRRSGGSWTPSAGAFVRERGFWRGVAATVSLRSFFRHLAPAAGARKRFAERGKRRALQPVRLTP